MANTSEIRKGLCIEFNKGIYSVVEFLHVKPGKGNAFVRTKLKSLTSGKVIDHTFSAGHRIETVRVERRKYQYLYHDDMGYHFMDSETYDQTTFQENLIDHPKFLKEGMDVEILFHAGNDSPLILEMPSSVVLKITYTEPGVRGDTATNATKPAIVETEAEIKVPLFINIGDKVKIDCITGNYLERVKE